MKRLVLAALLGATLVAGCGGDSGSSDNPVSQVPETRRPARQGHCGRRTPKVSDFPAAKGKTLQQLADGMGAGPPRSAHGELDLHGRRADRMAFGMIDKDGPVPSTGPTAVYVAPTPGEPGRGPVRRARRRAAHRGRATAPSRRRRRPTRSSPSTAPHVAVRQERASASVLAVDQAPTASSIAAPAQVKVSPSPPTRSPRSAQTAPKVAHGHARARQGRRAAKIDTRDPAERHAQASTSPRSSARSRSRCCSRRRSCASRACAAR